MTTITVPRLPIVSYHSPEQFELEMQLRMRLFKAAGLDAPEAIAEVQRIAAEQAGMVNVTEAADAIIEDLPSINAALMRAKKEAKTATPEALAATAAKEAGQRGGQRGGQSRSGCSQSGQEGQGRRIGGHRPAGPGRIQSPGSREPRARRRR
jgi:hypothetical protein